MNADLYTPGSSRVPVGGLQDFTVSPIEFPAFSWTHPATAWNSVDIEEDLRREEYVGACPNSLPSHSQILPFKFLSRSLPVCIK